MTTVSDIFNAFAPEYLERSPTLPTLHQKTISALQPCRSGHDGYRLYQCQNGGKQPRVNHACGNRHCPQCQQHTTPQWLPHQLDKQLPAPHVLRTFTVPETLRACIRSPQRLADHAMFTAFVVTIHLTNQGKLIRLPHVKPMTSMAECRAWTHQQEFMRVLPGYLTTFHYCDCASEP